MIKTLALLSPVLIVGSLLGSEADAVAISANIRGRHMPFGTVLDPVFESATSNQVVGYTRCGDSALWTGAYLAAESFRYKVTSTPEALDNVKSALAGLKSLVNVTGDNRLARCIVAASSPYAAGIQNEEKNNTVRQNPPNVWIDNTSRDQVVGAFFGLAAAYDLVDDVAVRSGVADLVTRLIGFISRHQWSPNDDISNTFLLRPEELRMLIQVANHVNPSNGVSSPFLLGPVEAGVLVDVQSNSSYFKFNLDYLTFYHLIRYQNNFNNQGAYKVLRNYTAGHRNAFFDIVDRAISGANAARDAEFRSLLDQWLDRSSRDFYVDLSKQVKVCGTAACDPVPVALRPPTDFIWQRDPFQLSGGGSGTIESAGIDYILPYWIGRYYGVLSDASVQSAAAPLRALAPDSLASLFGSNLSGGTVTIIDSAGIERTANVLYASASQINFVIPSGTAPGEGTIQIAGYATPIAVMIHNVAPALFTLNGTGSGPAAANISVDPRGFEQIYLVLYGTGVRHRSDLSDVFVSVNGMVIPALYAGPTPGFDGLDQINVQLPNSLFGVGAVPVFVTDGSAASNTVTISIQ